MSLFRRLPEFEKEFQKLQKKYRSLPEDLEKFEKILEIESTGIGKNFTIIYFSPGCKVVKGRMACKSLKDRSVRIIYAYHDSSLAFVHIELYFKGDKANEDRERVRQYLKNIGKN